MDFRKLLHQAADLPVRLRGAQAVQAVQDADDAPAIDVEGNRFAPPGLAGFGLLGHGHGRRYPVVQAGLLAHELAQQRQQVVAAEVGQQLGGPGAHGKLPAVVQVSEQQGDDVLAEAAPLVGAATLGLADPGLVQLDAHLIVGRGAARALGQECILLD